MPANPKGQSRIQNEFEVLKWLGKGAFGDVLKVIMIVLYMEFGGSTCSNIFLKHSCSESVEVFFIFKQSFNSSAWSWEKAVIVSMEFVLCRDMPGRTPSGGSMKNLTFSECNPYSWVYGDGFLKIYDSH
jgi:hypothetical protein